MVVAVAVPGGAGGFGPSGCKRPGWGAASGDVWAWGAAICWGSSAPGQDVLAHVEPGGAETVCPHVLSVRGQQPGLWQIP